MRLHIHKGGYDSERVNLIAMIALLAVVASAIFYLGMSFRVPTQAAGFFGPISSL